LEKTIIKKLHENFPNEEVSVCLDERGIVTLAGEVGSWQTLIDIGHAAALDGMFNVVSDMTVKGVTIPVKDYKQIRKAGSGKGVFRKVDVVIVGAGISGCGIARELSKYDLRVVVVEAGEDVATGSSKANNGCVHHGMDCKPGTLKSELNVSGNARYSDWEKELNINLMRCGCLEIITCEEDLPLLMARYEQGQKNGVPNMEIVDRKQAYEIEPALASEGIDVFLALYLPTHGLVETPYVCVALAENAVENGAEFLFNCTVCDVLTENNVVVGVMTPYGSIQARYVVNAAGLYADDIAAMAGDRMYTIHNRQGTLAVFDKSVPPTYQTMTSVLSSKKKNKSADSKGGGENGTPENNLIAGPSSKEVYDKEDVESTPEGMRYIDENCLFDSHNPKANIIRIFAGARPATFTEDFIIEASELAEGFVHVAGIQSPGVAAAPAIADRVVDIIKEKLLKKGETISLRDSYNPFRKRPVEFRHMTREEQAALVEKDPRYGRVICRCEQITEGEILDALHSGLPPQSVNALKNRVRAGMGRCQGGFCQPRVLEILARELQLQPTEITLKGERSQILLKNNRGEATS
jgi:glycerol-3-phosphate dehydrogenase